MNATDILNMIAIVDEAIRYMIRKFDPLTRMIIARDTGLLNDYFAVTKSQKIDLYHFVWFLRQHSMRQNSKI